MQAAASCRNMWYFKASLWLVISAKEPPKGKAMYVMLTSQSHTTQVILHVKGNGKYTNDPCTRKMYVCITTWYKLCVTRAVVIG